MADNFDELGMLGSADAVRVVADAFRRHMVQVSVVDPVCNYTLPLSMSKKNKKPI